MYKTNEIILILIVWGLIYIITGIIIVSYFCKVQFNDWLIWLK